MNNLDPSRRTRDLVQATASESGSPRRRHESLGRERGREREREREQERERERERELEQE